MTKTETFFWRPTPSPTLNMNSSHHNETEPSPAPLPPASEGTHPSTSSKYVGDTLPKLELPIVVEFTATGMCHIKCGSAQTPQYLAIGNILPEAIADLMGKVTKNAIAWLGGGAVKKTGDDHDAINEYLTECILTFSRALRTSHPQPWNLLHLYIKDCITLFEAASDTTNLRPKCAREWLNTQNLPLADAKVAESQEKAVSPDESLESETPDEDEEEAPKRSPSVSRMLAWRQLATHFLDSMNPRLDPHVVVLNCILDYDGPLPQCRLRHHAYRFVREAEKAIVLGIARGDGDADPHVDWIFRWIKRDRDLSENKAKVRP